MGWLKTYLLVLAVGGGKHLWDLLLLQDLLQELQVRLVLVVAGVGLAEIRNERATARSDELGDGQRGADAHDVLQIQIGLAGVILRGLVVVGAVEEDHGEVLALGVGEQLLLELLEVVVARGLLQVAGEADLATALGVGLVILNFVQRLQTLGGNDSRAVGDIARDDHLGKEVLVHLAGLGAQTAEVGADLSEARGRLDGVDVRCNGLGDGVAQGAQAAHLLSGTHVPLEAGIQQGVGLADTGAELDPIGVLLHVVDAGGREPVAHGADRLVARQQHALHLVVAVEVFPVVLMAGGRHVHGDLLEPFRVALRQGDLEAEGFVGSGVMRVSPSYLLLVYRFICQ